MRTMNDQTGHSFASYFKRAVTPLIVLSLLRDKAMYGYEISQAMSSRSQGKLSVPVLYTVLYRLEEQGYIYISDTIVENGRARNYYSITDSGRAYLSHTLAEFQDLSAVFLSFFDLEGTK